MIPTNNYQTNIVSDMKLILKSKIIHILAGLALPILVSGQEAAKTVADAGIKDSISTFGQDEILGFIVVFMLIPVIAMGVLFRNLVLSRYKAKFGTGNKNQTMMTLALLLLAGSSASAKGQSGVFGFFSDFTPITWVLLFLFFLECILITFFAIQIGTIVTPRVYDPNAEPEVNWWDKFNAFRPIKDEANFDTGHDYDGIRELDNVIPPWFTAAFALSILFAGVYLYRYHISHSAPLMLQEYKAEMDAAAIEDKQRLASQGSLVDENTVTLLGPDDINFGKTTFSQYCTPCHMSHGGSSPTGVGPNLTDDYWIHGGSIKDIFKSIKYGWPEKGMISWKDQLSANQIAQLASFIKSIHGTNPPDAKAPQGELYKEQAAAPATVPAATDTTAKKSM